MTPRQRFYRVLRPCAGLGRANNAIKAFSTIRRIVPAK